VENNFCNGLISFIHKKTICTKPLKWRACERKFHGGPNWSKKKARLTPWMEKGAQNLLAQIGSCGVV